MESKRKYDELPTPPRHDIPIPHLRELQVLRHTAELQEQHLRTISSHLRKIPGYVGCLFWFIFGPTLIGIGLLAIAFLLGLGGSLRFGY